LACNFRERIQYPTVVRPTPQSAAAWDTDNVFLFSAIRMITPNYSALKNSKTRLRIKLHGQLELMRMLYVARAD
jgi:hypothetical protein